MVRGGQRLRGLIFGTIWHPFLSQYRYFRCRSPPPSLFLYSSAHLLLLPTCCYVLLSGQVLLQNPNKKPSNISNTAVAFLGLHISYSWRRLGPISGTQKHVTPDLTNFRWIAPTPSLDVTYFTKAAFCKLYFLDVIFMCLFSLVLNL